MEAWFTAITRILIDALELQDIFSKLFKLLADVVHHIVMAFTRQLRDLHAAHGDGVVCDVNKAFLLEGSERTPDNSGDSGGGRVLDGGGIHGLNVHIVCVCEI
ncbi:hypothetical protein D3C81_1741530 [compost metagenome]